MTSPIRVLIVDDHAIVRKGIRALFRSLPDPVSQRLSRPK